MADPDAEVAKIKAAEKELLESVVATTRAANALAANDLAFLRTARPELGACIDERVAALLEICSSFLETAVETGPGGAKAGGRGTGSKLKAPVLRHPDDIELMWPRIVDVVDSLLERADRALDEYARQGSRRDVPRAELPVPPPAKRPKSRPLEYSLRRANIAKPQELFERRIDPQDASPWKPVLTSKPFASVTLEDSLRTFRAKSGVTEYSHPYEQEILAAEHPRHVWEVREPIPYLPVETTTATYVDTFEGVLEMLEELKKADEIAVDTEHHDYRTYSGLLCLMQISTRHRDWIVDTLQPWRHKLEVLHEVFANPNILKVFHGAHMDIVWLQRDLGLYIVGLWDTFAASDVLNFPARSLAYLLKRFVNFEADKKYQMADWRIRPLPEEMLYYARSDTHYLLYIYDMLRNSLLEKSQGKSEENYMELVLQRSKEIALRRHETPYYDAESGQGPGGWFNIVAKGTYMYSREQFAVLRAVHKWRDDLARREDESPIYIIPQQALTDIAKIMPTDLKALHSLLHGASPTVKKSLDELFKVIQDARAAGANGPSLMDILRAEDPSVTPRAATQNAEPEDSGPEINVDELRSTTSTLWGDVPLSTRWEPRDNLPKLLSNVHLTLPWMRGLSEGAKVAETSGGSGNEPENEASFAGPPQEPHSSADMSESSDAEFTLQRKGKRKAVDMQEVPDDTPKSSGATAGDDVDMEGDDMIAFENMSEKEKQDKQAQRRQKRLLKQARKMKMKEELEKAKKNGSEAVAQPTNNGPLDYSKATSVLHASKNKLAAEQGSGADEAKQKGKRFDPYSKTGEGGPKAARKMHSERPGKSATFRN